MGVIKSKSNTFFLWIFFLIYPLGAFIVAIKNYRFKEYRIFLLLFLSLLGYTFIPIPNSDGERHKAEFVSMVTYSFEKYVNDINAVIKGTSDSKDFYIITIKYISLLFSTDSKIFFLITAFLYFFVLLKFLSTLWETTIIKNKINLVYFVGICFTLSLAAGLNGIRFPMAFWVFSYGALNLILKNEIKYLLIAALSLLIHFSLGFSIFFLVLFYLSRYTSNRNVLFLLLTIVVIVAAVAPSAVASYLTVFGSGQEDSVNSYSNEDYIEGRENHIQQWNWYLQISFYSFYYFFTAVLILTKIKFFKLNFDTISNRLFGFVIIMLIHVLLASTFLDPISNRYMNFFNLFAMAYMFYLSSINQDSKFIKIARSIFFPFLILNILTKLRGDLYSLSPVLAFGNAVSVFIYDSTISVQDYLLN